MKLFLYLILLIQILEHTQSFTFLQTYKNAPIHIYTTSLDESESIAVDEDEDIPLVPNMEKAWRHSKKPLIRIGGQGLKDSHGNSLRQELDHHKIVKIKINTWKLGTLKEAFELLRESAEKAGAADGMELLKVRDSENMLLVGLQGMEDQILSGAFPPIKPVWIKYDKENPNPNPSRRSIKLETE